MPTMEINIKYIPAEAKKNVNNIDKVIREFQTPSLSDYTMVADENLFHPERKIPIEKKEEQSLPKPEFVLYGTLITDDLSIAFLEDLKAPRTTAGRGKRQIVLKKGDIMSGFTLNEIEVDKVVMVRGEEKMMLYVRDPQRPKTRDISAPIAKETPEQPVSKPPQTKPTSELLQKALIAPQSSTVKTEIRPPKSPEEQAIFEFFEKGKK